MKLKLLALSLFCPMAFAATSITGAGSTFIYPVLSQWTTSYAAKTGTQVNYQSIGSGGGISQIKAGTVDFAATDKPLAPAELKAAKLLQFPVIHGGIVLSENLHTANPLVLDDAVISGIYLGQIKYWNAPAIKALNPSLTLPHKAITVLYRADGSGTTYNFTKYLSAVNPTFAKTVGADTSVKFPVGLGAKGNAGVANFVKTIPGSIGYVEYAYAAQNNLAMASFKNSKGKVIAPSPQNFGNGSYPIMATTYALVPENSPKLKQIEAFFTYAYTQTMPAKKLGYIPLNGNEIKKIETSWK